MNSGMNFLNEFQFTKIPRIYPLVGGTKPTPRYYHASVLMHENTEMVIFGGIRPKEFL